VPRTIVGIAPDDFEFPNSPDLWFPIDDGFLQGRGAPDSDLRLLGLLAPGRSIHTAQDQLNTIAAQFSATRAPDRAVRMEVAGFTDLGPIAAGQSAGVIAMVLLVLIVIAANVGNLILARSFARSREFALRAALGAARRQLVGQVFLEVLLIAGTAAVIGSLAASVALRYFSQMDEIPFWVNFTGGPRTMILVAGATVLAAAVAGIWPALRATRRDLAGSLEGGGRSSDVRFGRTAGVLVTLQIALSIAMLHGALIFAQGLSHFTGESLPLPRNVVTTYLSVNGIRLAPGSADRVRSTADDVTRIASTIPGVLSAGIGTALPRHSPRPEPTEVEPLSGERQDVPMRAPSAEVSLGYFDVLEAGPLSGRLFTAADYAPGAPQVAVVNAPFVEKFFQGSSPIGRRIRAGGLNGIGPWREVVGVVPDLGLSVGDSTLAAGFYVPLGAETNYVYLALRVTGDPLSYTNALRRALLESDPGLIINHVQLLEDVAIEDREAFKILSAALVGIGGITLILALAGIYAMMALIVTRRTREIGIRMALGATTSRIVQAIVSRAAWQVTAGALLGCLLARLSLEGRMILVSRLGDGGTWTLPAVVGLLMLAGLAATWLPLRRALGVRPTDALRAE
jgi:predicted permease